MSRTISVPPACPLVDVLMSSEMATEKTAGVSGKLIHKSSFYECDLHVGMILITFLIHLSETSLCRKK